MGWLICLFIIAGITRWGCLEAAEVCHVPAEASPVIGLENVGILHDAINIPVEAIGINKLPDCRNDWMEGSVKAAPIAREENCKLFRQVSGVKISNCTHIIALIEPHSGLQGWGFAEVLYGNLEINICSSLGCLLVGRSDPSPLIKLASALNFTQLISGNICCSPHLIGLIAKNEGLDYDEQSYKTTNDKPKKFKYELYFLFTVISYFSSIAILIYGWRNVRFGKTPERIYAALYLSIAALVGNVVFGALAAISVFLWLMTI